MVWYPRFYVGDQVPTMLLFGDHFCLATIFVWRPFLFGDHFCLGGKSEKILYYTVKRNKSAREVRRGISRICVDFGKSRAECGFLKIWIPEMFDFGSGSRWKYPPRLNEILRIRMILMGGHYE